MHAILEQFFTQELSAGEVGKPRLTLADPFEKFLDQINTSTPDNSSSFIKDGPSIEHTLSELPSINSDPLAPPSVPVLNRLRRNKVVRRNKGSPGEVLTNKPKQKDSSISFPHSDGEMPRRLRARKNRPRMIDTTPLDVSVDTVLNEMRNGIDVINMSQPGSVKLQDEEYSAKNDDTLRSISQISISSSPQSAQVAETPRKLLLVRPYSPAEAESTVENEQPSLTRTTEPPLPKALSHSSSDCLPIISLSELDITDTVSKQKEDKVVVLLSSPQRAAITVTVPAASEDSNDDHHIDTYSSDFNFSSSVSIPVFD